ncbi:hypothetical protein HDU90_000882 [Geranomyces variabilis]|nr:hypothetical protein HDU90_000882 [Geranomyces variabilis]
MRILPVFLLASAVAAQNLYGRQLVASSSGTDSSSVAPPAPPPPTSSLVPATSSLEPVIPATSTIPPAPTSIPASTAVISTQIVLTTINNVVRTVTRVIESPNGGVSSTRVVVVVETVPPAGANSAAQLGGGGGAGSAGSASGTSGGITTFEIAVVVLGVVLGCVVASAIAFYMIRRGREEQKKRQMPSPSPRGPEIVEEVPTLPSVVLPSSPPLENDEALSTATAAPPAYDFAYAVAGPSVPPIPTSTAPNASSDDSAVAVPGSQVDPPTMDERLWIAREGCKAERPGQLTCRAGDALWFIQRRDDGFTEVLNATSNESGLVPDHILMRPKN